MSYDIVIIDHRRRFSDSERFLAWYNNAIEYQQDDYKKTTIALQKWFMKMKDLIRPLNGEFAPANDEIDNGEFLEADYGFGKDFIYVALAQTDADKTNALVFELAKEFHLAYFDISGTGELHNADGSHFLVSRHWIQKENQKEPHCWQVKKILYPPLIMSGISLFIIIYALVDNSKDSFVCAAVWMLFFLFVLWKSMDNIWFYRRMKAMSPRHFQTVDVSVNVFEHTGSVYDMDSGINYIYNSKEKIFSINVEYCARQGLDDWKKQFQPRLNQTQIPIVNSILTPKGSNIFIVSVRLRKCHASPKNIRRIRKLIVDLSKNNQQNSDN